MAETEGEVLTLLREINQRQKDFQDEVTNRFDEVDNRLAEVDKRFDEAKKEREVIREMVVNNAESITTIQDTVDDIKSDQNPFMNFWENMRLQLEL